MTQQSYAAVGQLGQLLAQEASSAAARSPGGALAPLLLARSPASARAVLSRCRGPAAERVGLGPGSPAAVSVLRHLGSADHRPRPGSSRGSTATARARRAGLPALEAVDEGSVEPPGALGSFLGTLPHPLAYPVAVDRSGRVADGYEVQGLPWLVLDVADRPDRVVLRGRTPRAGRALSP